MEQVLQTIRKNLVFLLFIILFSSSVLALQTFSQNQPARICHAVRVNDALPSSATCNITIGFSNGTRLVDFEPMEDLSDQFCYNLTAGNTSIKGLYNYEITCTDGLYNDTLDSEYLINLGGIEPSQERTDTVSRTIYIFFGLALLTFLSLFWVKKTPYKLSLFLIMIWFILMGINAAYISIQDEVVNTSLENFFFFFLTVSFYANYAIFLAIIIIWMITFIVSLLERHKGRRSKEYG